MYPPIELRLFTRPYIIDPMLRGHAVKWAAENLFYKEPIEHDELVCVCNEDLKLSEELTAWDQQQLERITVLQEGTRFQQLLTGINLYEIPPEDTLDTDYMGEYGLNLTTRVSTTKDCEACDEDGEAWDTYALKATVPMFECQWCMETRDEDHFSRIKDNKAMCNECDGDEVTV